MSLMERNWQRARLGKLFRNLGGVEAILLANENGFDPNFRYLTAFRSGLFEGSILVATRSRLFLITSQLEYQTAMDQKTSSMTVISSSEGAEAVRRRLKKLIGGKRIGINAHMLPVAAYKRLSYRYKPKKMIDVSEALLKTRLVKDEGEIGEIRKAAKVTKTAMRMIRKHFKAGVTELELAARFDFIQMSLGASRPSFDTIVCFGKNAAQPHHSPDGTRLRKGDFILIDAGAKVNNYCSDITRTFVFGGKANARQKEMLKLVADAQKAAIDAIRPGKDGRKIHAIAADMINGSYGGRYKGRFIHALGHSVGLEVHDGPGFIPGEKNILAPGMVITAEPGVYLPGFGGVRFEDDVLVTKKGHELL